NRVGLTVCETAGLDHAKEYPGECCWCFEPHPKCFRPKILHIYNESCAMLFSKGCTIEATTGGGVAQYIRSGTVGRLRKNLAIFLPNTCWLSNRLTEIFFVYPGSCTNVILKSVLGKGRALKV